MKRTHQNIQNRQDGMVSHLLLFIVLIMLANAAIFAPNIAALKDTRQSAENIGEDRLLNLLASSIARAQDSTSGIRSSGNTITPIAAVALNSNASDIALDSSLTDMGNAYSSGGKPPRHIRQIAPTRLQSSIRYCPYSFMEAGYNSTAYRNGRIPIDVNQPILFSIIINKSETENLLSCADALADHSNGMSKYINVTTTQALAMIRSAQTEASNLNEGACPAGEEMVFTYEHQEDADGDPETDGDITIPTRFECKRNLLGLASTPGSSDASNCTINTALNSRGDSHNGVDCADIDIRESTVNTQTYDNVNRQIVSLYEVDQYYDAVSPLNPDGSFRNIPGLADFDCPQTYYDNHQYFPGTRSKAVIVLRDGTLLCAGGWSLLNHRPQHALNEVPCPEGKKIVWEATVPGSARFVCEGVNANDTTWGRWEPHCGLDDDEGNGNEDQVVGYSPNTNRFYCFLASNSQSSRDRDYVYPERSESACVANAALTLTNDVADCSTTYPQMLHTGIHALPSYHAEWAYNWDPITKTMVATDPGGIVYLPSGLPSNPDTTVPSGVDAVDADCGTNGSGGDQGGGAATCNVNNAVAPGPD